ncbi:hypothetical protein MUK60_23200 [Streptomyces sp. LRE541]|uniref:hypothetical protein n=1 Tax=Streptomyces sp. LRE541 TaxID=2931983 RepID=UPI00200BE56B|nr:hypothetical protein [Streptomyces sp. LRE541]UPZ30433.1 hypothetical protein MUK60_23200 [Streptomyces sp. LRE541]
MGTHSRAFGSWRLQGGRYEQPGLPVEVLAEFARYERLVVDVARGLYKQRHASRQRVPRGFASSFSLRLSDIRRGSVIPVLERTAVDADALFDDRDAGIFEEARMIIQDALRSIQDGSGIPRTFPPHALREFSRFGRSLRDDELIEFDSGTSNAVIYSQPVRRQIQEQARLERFEIETLVSGQVVGVSADKGVFEFRLTRGDKVVPGRFSSDDIVADLKQYLDLSTMAPTVAINAVAIQSMNEDIIEIQDVLSIEPVLPPEWSERLAELHDLEAGWLDGVGQQVSRKVLRQAESLLLEFLDEQVKRPYIYPTEDGGVQLEWPYSSGEVTLTITSDEKVEAYAFSKEDDRENDRAFHWRQLSEITEFVIGGITEYAD